MKIGDLVKVTTGIEYELEHLGVIVEILVWHGIREVKVRLTNGDLRSFPPRLIRKVN